ncbi:MAG: hypothetical protein RID11_12815, partial [Roseovarius sp.]|uniref:hypothetical protein n=1 Tax=Roseovarius sp. TaxID=1486281 RepID=UPI0032EC61E3
PPPDPRVKPEDDGEVGSRCRQESDRPAARWPTRAGAIRPMRMSLYLSHIRVTFIRCTQPHQIAAAWGRVGDRAAGLRPSIPRGGEAA